MRHPEFQEHAGRHRWLRRAEMSGYRFDQLKVLVVDDNLHMRRLVTAILQAFGAKHIFEAPDGEKAWNRLREVNPDVIILDWMMDAMNGVELTKLIRTSSSSPNPFVPIIMLSGHTSAERVREARDSGINEFLAKPVSANTMLSHLTSVIENPRPYIRTKNYFGPCRRRFVDVEYAGPERRATVDNAGSLRAAAVG